jgi:integrase
LYRTTRRTAVKGRWRAIRWRRPREPTDARCHQAPRSGAAPGKRINGRPARQQSLQPPTLNSSASALRFFFDTTLDRAELARHLARVHYPRKLPRVLSPEEVGRLLEAAPGPGVKYKAALSIAYGAGLRAGEVVMLRVSDIDSKRMLIRVEPRAHLAHSSVDRPSNSCDQMKQMRLQMPSFRWDRY